MNRIVDQKTAIDHFLTKSVCRKYGLVDESGYNEFKSFYFYADDLSIEPIQSCPLVSVYALITLINPEAFIDISVFERLISDGFAISEYCYSFISMRSDITSKAKARLFQSLKIKGICMSHTIYAEIARCPISPEIKEIYHLLFTWESSNTNVPSIGMSRDGVFGSSFFDYRSRYFRDLEELGFSLDFTSVNMILGHRIETDNEEVKAALSFGSDSLKSGRRFDMILASVLDFYSISQGIVHASPNFYLASELYKMGYKPPSNMWDLICPFRVTYRVITECLVALAIWYLDTIFEDNGDKELCCYWSEKNNQSTCCYDQCHTDYARELEDHPRLKKAKERVIKQDRKEYIRVYKISPEGAANCVLKAQAKGVCMYWKQHRCDRGPSVHVNLLNHFGLNYQGTCPFYHGREENTYKLKEKPSTSVRRRFIQGRPDLRKRTSDPTACMYLTGTRDDHLDRSATHYINTSFIPLSIETQVANVINWCWWVQYEPEYISVDANSGFKLVPARCPVTGNSKGLRFMVKKSDSMWSVYYYTIEALESCEGSQCPYYLQEAKSLVY